MTLSERARTAVPVRFVPLVARARARWALRDDATRGRAREHMELLLGVARPEADLDRETVAFVRFYLARPELHRRPEVLHHTKVLDTEHLERAAAQGRGVVLQFLHHGLFEGSLASLGRQGLLHELIAEAELAGPDLTGSRLAFARMLGSAVPMHSTDIGATGIERLVRGGATVGLATDRPGRTPVVFCGRRLWTASGAARVARSADAPIVPMTAERTASGEMVGRLRPAVEPSHFESTGTLMQHLVSLHEPSVLAWPSGYSFPADCWGTEQMPLPGRAGR